MPHAFIYTAPLPFRPSSQQSACTPLRPPRINYSQCRYPKRLRPHMSSTSLNESPPPQTETPNRNPPAFPLSVLALTTFALLTLYTQRGQLSALLHNLTTQLSHLGPLRGSLLLALVNFFTVLFCFPANMGLMIGAGAVLGALPAFLALFFSKLAAACVAFLLARGVLYGRASRTLASYPRLSKVLNEMGKDGGWKFVLLMRLSPFPGFLLNYLLSLTGVGFAEYVWATMIGIAPSVSNLVLLGATAKEMVGGPSSGWLPLAIKVLCVASMFFVTVFIGRRVKAVFKDLEEEGEISLEQNR